MEPDPSWLFHASGGMAKPQNNDAQCPQCLCLAAARSHSPAWICCAWVCWTIHTLQGGWFWGGGGPSVNLYFHFKKVKCPLWFLSWSIDFPDYLHTYRQFCCCWFLVLVCCNQFDFCSCKFVTTSFITCTIISPGKCPMWSWGNYFAPVGWWVL